MRPDPGSVSSSVLTSMTMATLPWVGLTPILVWAIDTIPGDLWLGKELEPQRAGGICTLVNTDGGLSWPSLSPSPRQAWPFVLVLGVGNAVATLRLLSCSKEQIAKDLLSGEEEEETQSSADDLTPSVTSHEASDLFHNKSGCRCHWPF